MKLVLIALLLVPSLAIACSDPVKHREHLLREMQAAQAASNPGSAASSGTRGAAPSAQNNLDASEVFFGGVGRDTRGTDSPRRRSRDGR